MQRLYALHSMLLKRLISYWLLPFPFALTLLLIGVALLWFSRRQGLGRGLVTASAALLLLFSFRPSGAWLTAPLRRFAPLTQIRRDAAGARWVVVLGAGYSSRAGVPPNGRLDPIALERLVEGVRVYHALPGAKLVLSGGVGPASAVPQASVLADAAQMLGVPRSDMVLESTSEDTQDEARLLRDVLRDDRFVLVTSETHMWRSLRLFEKQGLHPIAAPSGFWPDPALTLPTSSELHELDAAQHEYVGILWSRLRGTL